MSLELRSLLPYPNSCHTAEIDGDDLIIPKERCKGGRSKSDLDEGGP
jgi:hypothetical protein